MSIKSLLSAIALGCALAACGGSSDGPAPQSAGDSRQSSLTVVSQNAIVLAGNRADYTLTTVGRGFEFVHNKTGVATPATAQSRVRFADLTVGMDISGNAGKVYRLYQAAFNRVPDIQGLSFWIESMDKGQSLTSIAAGFVSSAEYKAVYGAAPTNLETISRYYKNVLQRDGEEAGISYWTGVLQAKTATVPDVLGGFSESPENQAGILPAIRDGITFRESGVNYVAFAHAGPARTASAGTIVTLDGGNSLPAAGRTLTYTWSILSVPAGSKAALSATSTMQTTITPDVSGTYRVSLLVNDGATSATAVVSVTVAAPSLNFAPLESHFSKGLNRLIVASTNPNTLKIVDPASSSIKSVALPLPVKNFSLSPNGKLAVVLHESIASLVDLEGATLIKSFSTGGSHTDAFVTDAAVSYFIGQTGGQWVRPAVVYFNGRTGVEMTPPETASMGNLYGTQYGIFAPTKNKVFLMSLGLSPADINFFSINATTNAVTAYGDSPYHGDYNMSPPLFLSSTEDILFTASGNYFYTSNLKYAGTFGLQGSVLSLSNSAEKDETLVISNTSTTDFPASYQRFTGALFFPDAKYGFPVIDGKQSYGRKIYHTADGRRVALVQTGSSLDKGPNVRYYVVVL